MPRLPSSTASPAAGLSGQPRSGSTAAGDRARPDQGNWIAVGVVKGAFGVQGALKVEPYTGVDSTVLNHVHKWRLDAPQSGTTGPGQPSLKPGRQLPFQLPAEVSVQGAKQHSGFLIATIAPEITREQALALKGIEVLVERADFPAAGPDEYYWTDLIGCAVVDPSGAPLGTVAAVDDHGAQAVLRLDGGLLIPFVTAFILEVAPAQRRIIADWSADWA